MDRHAPANGAPIRGIEIPHLVGAPDNPIDPPADERKKLF
jgi:hypothetical protein